MTYSSGSQRQPQVTQQPDLNATTSIVYHLVRFLPYEDYTFHIYMDNKFSSVELFSKMRQLGIGACGTTRPTYKHWPKEWSKVKTNAKETLYTLKGFGGLMARAVGPKKDVKAFVWIDTNVVQGLTTIHDFGIGDFITQEHRRPTGKSTCLHKEAQRAYGDGPEGAIVSLIAVFIFQS